MKYTVIYISLAIALLSPALVSAAPIDKNVEIDSDHIDVPGAVYIDSDGIHVDRDEDLNNSDTPTENEYGSLTTENDPSALNKRSGKDESKLEVSPTEPALDQDLDETSQQSDVIESNDTPAAPSNKDEKLDAKNNVTEDQDNAAKDVESTEEDPDVMDKRSCASEDLEDASVTTDTIDYDSVDTTEDPSVMDKRSCAADDVQDVSDTVNANLDSQDSNADTTPESEAADPMAQEGSLVGKILKRGREEHEQSGRIPPNLTDEELDDFLT